VLASAAVLVVLVHHFCKASEKNPVQRPKSQKDFSPGIRQVVHASTVSTVSAGRGSYALVWSDLCDLPVTS